MPDPLFSLYSPLRLHELELTTRQVILLCFTKILQVNSRGTYARGMDRVA